MKTAKPNQRVAFTQDVIRRARDQARTANMRGTILEVYGRVARVDTHGTYPNEDGKSIRWIPLANLTPILDNGAFSETDPHALRQPIRSQEV